MTEYLAETVNPEYSDMVARVKFASGKAILSEEVASGTDRDLPELIRVFEDLGITIKEVKDGRLDE